MKRLLIIISLFTITNSAIGQIWCGDIAMPRFWNFDGGQTPTNYILEIDTISNPTNIWQIGTPQKGVIVNAYSNPNVIITDTINSYPPNDTSIFIFKHIDEGGYSAPHSAELGGYYYVNSDSLNDFGTIEVSLNQGLSWIDLITDTVYNSHYYWWTPKPILTGNSNGWKEFKVSLEGLGSAFNVGGGDTILMKFSFISDSNADTLDGLAFDNFTFCDGVEGIEEILKENLISIYPNPTSGLLYIERQSKSSSDVIEIFDSTGRLIFKDNYFKSDFIDTKGLNLKNGIFLLKFSDNSNYTTKRFVVQN